MFPLRDINPGRTFPWVNYLLIGINSLVFFYQLSLSSLELQNFLLHYAVIPHNFLVFKNLSFGEYTWQMFWPLIFSLLSSTFLHGGWLHFILNMWALQIFGNNVEDSMGHIRYFVFYILAGIVGNLVHIVFFGNSQTPLLGASGSIAGVMSAYLFLFPSSKILTLVPILIFPLFLHIHSFFYIAIWFVFQLFGGISQLAESQVSQLGGVAFWVHIGGFVWGAFTHRLFLLPSQISRE